MKYHAPTRCFVFDQKAIEYAAMVFLHAIKHIREQAGLSLTPYKHDSMMDHAQFAEQSIIDAAKALGIELGADRYGRLDVSNSA